MRVISGSARGRLLRAPKSGTTRPTADRVKEALFSMVESLLLNGRPEADVGTPALWHGLRVLDLYAGSGALGIEALSRGAAHATFVEGDRAAVSAIEANLAATGLAPRAAVRLGDAATLVARLVDPVDLVFMDPPYADVAAVAVAERVADASWVALDTILCLEHSGRLAAPDKLGTLRRQRERRYGETVLTLYARGAYLRPEARDGQGVD